MASRSLYFTVLLLSSGLASAAPPSTFALHDADAYFTTGPAAAGVVALRLDRSRDAVPLFTEALKHEKTHVTPLKFLLATAELRAGLFGDAARHFDELREHYPLLADYVAYGAARAHFSLRHVDEAIARLDTLPDGALLEGDAILLRADIERGRGQPRAAATLLTSYLTKFPTTWRAHEIRLKLARALEAANDHDAANVEYRKLYIEAPSETYGQEAAKSLGDTASAMDASDRLRRAMAYFDAMRNKESEDEFRRVLTTPQATIADQCVAKFHLAQSVFKQRDRSRAAPLFDEASDTCEKAANEDLWVKALFQAGRSYGSKGQKEPATAEKGLQRFATIVDKHPAHSYADDARLRQAELAAELGRDDEARTLLASVATLFPSGDQRGEALWRLAFAAIRASDFDTANKWLLQTLTEMPRQEGWWEAGRTLYWLGRVAELQKADGVKVKAIDYYERAVKEYPLAYYALVALNRLRALDDKRCTKLIDAMQLPAAQTHWTFTARPLFGEPGFKRTVELLRLGLGTEARRELGALGLTAPKRGTPVAPEDEDKLWMTAALLDRAEQWSASHAIPRYALTSYEKSWPTGENYRRWRVSYPRGYAELVEPNATANTFRPELEYAIIREESAYDPLMESFANAVGLTQLTADPAERFAKGLPHDRAALKIPSNNVPIGAREIGSSIKTYGGQLPLAIAAYNAGEGAVNRWLRDPTRYGELDLFVENIPYDETRGYTKRVLATYFAYSWLDGKTNAERVPTLSFTLPKK